jgi:hypothetical protein
MEIKLLLATFRLYVIAVQNEFWFDAKLDMVIGDTGSAVSPDPIVATRKLTAPVEHPRLVSVFSRFVPQINVGIVVADPISKAPYNGPGDGVNEDDHGGDHRELFVVSAASALRLAVCATIFPPVSIAAANTLARVFPALVTNMLKLADVPPPNTSIRNRTSTPAPPDGNCALASANSGEQVHPDMLPGRAYPPAAPAWFPGFSVTVSVTSDAIGAVASPVIRLAASTIDVSPECARLIPYRD